MTAVGPRRRYFLLSVLTVAVVVAAVSLLVVPINALWLRPLSIPSPDRLVVVTAVNQDVDGSRFSDRGLERLAGSDVFAGVAGQVLDRDLFAGLRPQFVFPDGPPVETLSVTPNYFDVVGIAVKGRGFERTDAADGAHPVAVVSELADWNLESVAGIRNGPGEVAQPWECSPKY